MKDWIQPGRAAADQLLRTSDLLSGKPGEMIDRLCIFSEAEAAAQPFLAAAAERLDEIRADIGSSLAGSGVEFSVEELLAGRDSEAAREVRSLYRVALKISREPKARDVVVDLSANRAFRTLTESFPDIAIDLTAHLQEYGWVRTVSTGLDILSPKEALQRIQIALLRWNAQTIAAAADPPPAKAPEMPEDIRGLVAEFLELAGDPAFSPGLPVKARWKARLFFGEVATALKSKLHEVLNAPAHELVDAVESGNGLAEMPASGSLTGAAVSLGRAVGRVRVVLDADRGGKIQVGDIIVTDLSTPTYEGQPSMFPYRTVPSVAVDKAAAVVTDEGGLLSHAAIICRENQVPALLGAERASTTLADGMIVEVDATRSEGSITILSR
jgi:phosphohistidine swiveling domain-containing protein